MNSANSIIIWNIRGAHNEPFMRNLKDIIRTHNPCILDLLETRLYDHTNMKNHLNFDGMLQVPTVGRSEGIFLLWHNNLVVVIQVSNYNQELHAMVQVTPNQQAWLLNIIYASTDVMFRNNLWLVIKK